jgi:circadian clock protein KaiC
MKCPMCQAENLDTEELCHQCGAQLRRVCPKCGANNSPQYAFCCECGYKLAIAPEPVPVAREGRVKLKKVCPKCGAHNPPEYGFCGECGCKLIFTTRIEPKAPEPITEAQEPRREALEQIAIAEEPIPETREPIPEATEPIPVPTEAIPETPEVIPVAPVEKPIPVAKVEIKAHPRVSTGIEGLDQLIGGGFLTNKVYLISGESGTGKTVFGLQYLYRGLIQGESGIYVSGDEKPNHLIVDAESLGWHFDKYVHEHKLGLLDVSPHFADLRSGKAKRIDDVRTVVADLANHAKAIGAKRIVIDPIAPLVFGQESSAVVQDYVRNLIFAIEDNLQCTILITSGILPGTSALSHYGVEEFVAEGVIVLGMGCRAGQRVRTLFIRKMRSTPTDLNEHIFEILPSRGIVIKE